jgi:hypothetical protein
MNPRGIHVEKKRGTRIRVDRWPRSPSPAAWTISTTEGKGRNLVVSGRHDLSSGVVDLASATIHVPGRGEPSLLVTGITTSGNLIDSDRLDAYLRLLACSTEIAVELHSSLGVGDGCLEWRVETRSVAELTRTFRDFSAVELAGKRAKSKRLRGRSLLRKCV